MLVQSHQNSIHRISVNNLTFPIGLSSIILSIAFGWFDCIGWKNQFFALSGLLVLYNFFELYSLSKNKQKTNIPYFFNPIVLTTIFTFYIFLGGFTNFLLLKDGYLFSFDNYFHPDDPWIPKAMALISLSSICMWFGYKTVAGTIIFKNYFALYARYLNYDISINKVLAVFIAAFIIKIMLFQSGQFGYQTLLSEDDANPGRLKTFEELSKLVFIVVSFIFFNKKIRNIKYSFLFFVCFILEVFFSLIHGARGPIVTLFLLTFLIQYFHNPKIKLSAVIVGILVLYASFTIVHSYKNFLLSDPRNAGSSVSELYEGFDKSRKNIEIDKDLGDLLYYASIGRLNYVNETALAIQYIDKYGLDVDDPPIVKNFFLSPIFAFIPQYFVLGQNPPELGRWFNYKIMGDSYDTKVSIAFSPVGFLYMVGGTLGVLLGFFGLGVLLKFTFNLLNANTSPALFILYLAMLSKLVLFDTNVGGVLINILRYIFLLPLALFFLIGKMRVR